MLVTEKQKFLDINHTYDLIIRMTDTKQRILDAAEKLFGENGYAATSMRHIISEAKVNLACRGSRVRRVSRFIP